ncbi:MAG: HAD family hydrolase [Ktedonobacteraceae bacterium]|nr:HAD family hydrolase [Ktedonobacteraceae bacterium]MBO0795201.1 HAD family hydrolase [Ktedonobacteraceae bacterium]
MMDIKGILFDLDGTLVNTLPLCIEALRNAFLPFKGRALSDEEITAHFGLNEEGIIRNILAQRWQEGMEVYLRHYQRLHEECREPFADMTTALELLRQRGIPMAVVTGKGVQTARMTLQYTGIEHYFDKCEFGEVHANVKREAIGRVLKAWKIEPGQAAYIGDAPSDIVEATAAGVLPLAARWAPTETIHRLTTIQPFVTFESVQGFIDWLDKNVEPLHEMALPPHQ